MDTTTYIRIAASVVGVLSALSGATVSVVHGDYFMMAVWLISSGWAGLYLGSLIPFVLLLSDIEQSLDEASFDAWMKGWFAHGQGVPLGANPWLRFIDEGVED